MTERRYYICDAKRRVRVRGTHRTLGAALRRCKKLNEADPGRYFCGDWCEVAIAIEYINGPRAWPWDEL